MPGCASSSRSSLISSEVGVEKPEPRIFAWALSQLGVPPSEALHAGDHPEHDWRGAEAAGLHVFRLAPPGDLPGSARILPPWTCYFRAVV